nr:hypothetical protein [Mesorhizobium sp. B2-4-14]
MPVAQSGLSFDLQLFPAQMKDGLTLVGENLETNFILIHAGMLTGMDKETQADIFWNTAERVYKPV